MKFYEIQLNVSNFQKEEEESTILNEQQRVE